MLDKIISLKKILSLSAVFAIVLPSFAQQKNAAYEMNVNGVKVVVQPSGNEIVEIVTFIKGGVQNYSADKAGIESLAITALTECGTAKDDKNSFKNKLDKVSAQISGDDGMDFGSFTMNCIKSDFDVVWPLYVDALTTPRFDAKEFDRIKQDAINSLKAQASQPDYAINKLAKQTAFAGKNYAKDPSGTEATIKTLTAEQTKDYYSSILTRSRMLIVVVGELDKATLEQKIKDLTASIPEGKPFTPSREQYTPAKNSFKAEKKDLATNYIQGVTSAPLPGTPNYNAFLLASRIFYDRQFLEVRTNNGLSYAPYTQFDGGLSPSFNIDVSTTQPDKYIAVMNKLIEKTKKQGFTADEVKDMKSTYLTAFYYRQETNGAQAQSLGVNEILHNDWHRALRINEDLKKVSVADVSNAFNKYVGNITWVYQGDPAKVTPTLFATPPTTKPPMPKSKVVEKKKD